MTYIGQNLGKMGVLLVKVLATHLREPAQGKEGYTDTDPSLLFVSLSLTHTPTYKQCHTHTHPTQHLSAYIFLPAFCVLCHYRGARQKHPISQYQLWLILTLFFRKNL